MISQSSTRQSRGHRRKSRFRRICCSARARLLAPSVALDVLSKLKRIPAFERQARDAEDAILAGLEIHKSGHYDNDMLIEKLIAKKQWERAAICSFARWRLPQTISSFMRIRRWFSAIVAKTKKRSPRSNSRNFRPIR